MWDQVEAKDACLRRLDERGFPVEMRALAEASDRFYELGVYYRNPLEVCTTRVGRINARFVLQRQRQRKQQQQQ